MALTDQDFLRIKGIVRKETTDVVTEVVTDVVTRLVDNKFDNFALMMQNQFTEIHDRFDRVEAETGALRADVHGIKADLVKISSDQSAVIGMAKDHAFRIARLEQRQV